MLNEHGHVTEGSGENIFLVRDGVLWTPLLSATACSRASRATP